MLNKKNKIPIFKKTTGSNKLSKLKMGMFKSKSLKGMGKGKRALSFGGLGRSNTIKSQSLFNRAKKKKTKYKFWKYVIEKSSIGKLKYAKM